ncbi:exosome complex exonuclease RRP44 homolog A [Tanacetum coccineum]
MTGKTKERPLKKEFLQRQVESYVKSLGQPTLLDLLVQPHASKDMEIEDLRPSKKKVIYTKITSGMRCGIYHQGKLRVNCYNPFEAYVGSESIGDEIIIFGRENCWIMVVE